MNFKFYDIMSSIIHGAIIVGTFILLFNIEYDKVWSIYLLVASFYVGYFVNMIGGWLECIYWFIGGKPSKQLFHKNKNCTYSGWGRIRFHYVDEIVEMLKIDCSVKDIDEDLFFARACQVVNNQKDNRVADFNANYVFSRSILTTLLIVSLIVIVQGYDKWYSYLILIPVVMCFIRYCERGYYFAKEVLSVYYNFKK